MNSFIFNTQAQLIFLFISKINNRMEILIAGKRMIPFRPAVYAL